jgi:exopolyphosphatase/pppGpp-phosphohydrolase
MVKTERFVVIEQDQEIVRFNERLLEERTLSPDQRMKRILARLRELCHAKQQRDVARKLICGPTGKLSVANICAAH